MTILKSMSMVFAVSATAFSYAMDCENHKNKIRLAYHKYDKASAERIQAQKELIALEQGWRHERHKLLEQRAEESSRFAAPYLQAEKEVEDERKKQSAKL